MNIDQTCTFVGHRTNELSWGHDEHSPHCLRLKQLLTQKIRQKIDNGCHTFITSALPGAEMMCAETVLQLRRSNPMIDLEIVCPGKAVVDKWDELSRQRYASIMDQADRKIILIGSHGKGRIREHKRWMIRNSGHLIAIYNGRDRLCDTYQAIKMARIKSRNIITINPENLQVEITYYELASKII